MRLRGRWRTPALAVLGGVLLGGAITASGLQYNATDSLPHGFYRTTPPNSIIRGDHVHFCMPKDVIDRIAGYVPLGTGRCHRDTQAVAKIVVGVPGDTIRHTAASVSVNGRALPESPTYTTTSRGHGMIHAPYQTRVLGAGEYWVYSPYADRSLDSRVFGPVQREALRGRWTPLLTWTVDVQDQALRARGLPVASATAALLAVAAN